MKKIVFFTFIICSVASSCYSQIYFEEGRTAFVSYDFDKAIEFFSKSIESKQNLGRAYLFRGASKLFLHQVDEALKDLDQSKQFDSADNILNYYYGNLYLYKGEPALAIAYYDKAILKDPKDAVSYSERAQAKFHLNNFKGCIADEDAAIALDSSNENFYAIRGFAKVKLKRYKEAVIDLNNSLWLKPNEKAYTWRGLVWSFTNQHEKAIEDYTKALDYGSTDKEVYCYRGIAYSNVGKKAEACSDLKKSYELGFAEALAFIKDNKCDLAP